MQNPAHTITMRVLIKGQGLTAGASRYRVDVGPVRAYRSVPSGSWQQLTVAVKSGGDRQQNTNDRLSADRGASPAKAPFGVTPPKVRRTELISIKTAPLSCMHACWPAIVSTNGSDTTSSAEAYRVDILTDDCGTAPANVEFFQLAQPEDRHRFPAPA